MLFAPGDVAGLAAAKFRVEAKTAQGQEFKGFAWLTAQRILVKLEGEVKQGRRTRRLVMTDLRTKLIEEYHSGEPRRKAEVLTVSGSQSVGRGC